MPIGSDVGDSGNTALTEDQAAAKIEALFSDEEEKEPTEIEPKTPAAEETPEGEESADEAEATDDEGEEAEPSDPDESEETDDTDDETEQPAKVKVKINGQDTEVTLDEALAGYSRTQDYTQKTQKLSEERKAFEAEQAAIRAERQQIHAKLTEYENTLQAQFTEPDWEQLLAEDPNSFARVHAAWQIHEKKIAKAAEDRAVYEQQMVKDYTAQHEQQIRAEAEKLHAAIPEWKDAEVAKSEKLALKEYAKEVGFPEDQLAAIDDHRAILLLRKAMLFDRAEKAKVAAAKKAMPKIEKVKTAKPGPANGSKKPVSEFAKRSQRLKRSHSVDDAASLIELMDL